MAGTNRQRWPGARRPSDQLLNRDVLQSVYRRSCRISRGRNAAGRAGHVGRFRLAWATELNWTAQLRRFRRCDRCSPSTWVEPGSHAPPAIRWRTNCRSPAGPYAWMDWTPPSPAAWRASRRWPKPQGRAALKDSSRSGRRETAGKRGSRILPPVHAAIPRGRVMPASTRQD